MVLSDDGHIYSWGWGKLGQLGLGHENTLLRPTLIESLSSHVMTQIACGGVHSGAITAHGHVYTWGEGSYGQLGLGKRVMKEGKSLIPRLVEVPIHQETPFLLPSPLIKGKLMSEQIARLSSGDRSKSNSNSDLFQFGEEDMDYRSDEDDDSFTRDVDYTPLEADQISFGGGCILVFYILILKILNK